MNKYLGSFSLKVLWILLKIDKRGTQKYRIKILIMMHKALHPRDEIDRLYKTRKRGKKRKACREDCVNASIQRLKEYINKSNRG